MLETVDESPQKKVILTNTRKKVWKAEFEGVVTRRDIIQLQRTLTVEFSRFLRARTIKKRKLEQDNRMALAKKDNENG
jgi:hypothetical protein